MTAEEQADTEEQLRKQALVNARKDPFYKSKKFWLGTEIILTWTLIIWLLIDAGIGVQSGSATSEVAGSLVPREMFWALCFKVFIETLIMGGVQALDYFNRLPFAQIFAQPSSTIPVLPDDAVETPDG